MDKEWLGLVLPAWALLIFLGYFSAFPATFGAELERMHPSVGRFVDDAFKYGQRITALFFIAIVPVLFLGFTLGVFQRYAVEPAAKWYGHVVGAINVVLIFGLFQLYAP